MRRTTLIQITSLLLTFGTPAALLGQGGSQRTPAEEKSDSSESGSRDSEGTSPNSPGQEALSRVKKLGFRLSPKTVHGEASTAAETSDASNPSEQKSPASSASEDRSPGEMKVGRVQEPVELPAELTGTAKEAALAVAEGKWEQAKKLYTSMSQKVPDNALIYANLGVVEYQMGDLTNASSHLLKSTEINPHLARNWQTLGLIQYEQGNLLLALSSLTRALHEDSDQAETRVILAAVARDYGWLGTSIVELERAVELNPNLSTAHYNLALSYLEERPPRIELARRHYYAAIDLGMKVSPELEAALKGAGDRTRSTESPKEAK